MLWNTGRPTESNPVHSSREVSMCVHNSGKLLEWLPLTRGVRQEVGGCHGYLMCLRVEYIMSSREAMEKLQVGVKLTTTNVQMLLFTDNIAILTKKNDMRRILGEMKRVIDIGEQRCIGGIKMKLLMVSRTEELKYYNIETVNTEAEEPTSNDHCRWDM